MTAQPSSATSSAAANCSSAAFCKDYIECLCSTGGGSMPEKKGCEACIASHKRGWDKNIPPGLKCTFNRATTLCDEQPVPPPSPTPAPCSTAEDCSLLGRCNNGVCECKKGWTGRVCSKGDFAPLDSGKWQLMATEIKDHCPLILFQYNSMVVRAVSTTADAGGPYVHQETVLPPFHHNPTFVGPTPEGYYLLFYIGTDSPGNEIDCRTAIPDKPIHPDPPLKSNGYTTMAYTKDIVNGPWQEKIVLRNNQDPLSANQSLSWHCNQNNPTAQILSNGTVVLVFRANACDPYSKPPLCKSPECTGEKLGVAIADHFLSDFVTHPDPIVATYIQNITTNNEDPFLWTDPTDNSWHIVNHQQSAGNVCGSPDAGHSCGAHFYANDPRGPWKMSADAVYGPDVVLKNGTAASFQTRQRPQLVFNQDGSPSYLFTSGSFEGNNPDLNMLSHTFAHKFN
eukprot:gene9446-31613_t